MMSIDQWGWTYDLWEGIITLRASPSHLQT
jgi:hypothetical protein